MDNPEKLATYGTKDKDKQKQTHNTKCIGLQYVQTNTIKTESVYRRRTDNTMVKKKYKRTKNNLQNIHIKLKIE